MYPALEKSTAGLSVFSLPGQGTPADGCGDAVPYHCRTHDRGFWVRSHCNERTCPSCYERWAKKAARKASLRVSWGAKVVTQQRLAAGLTGRPRLVHVVVSIPELEGWDVPDYRQACYSLCQEHNIVGGVAVIHPFRKDDYDAQYVPDGHVHFHVVGVNFEDIPPGGRDYIDKHLVIFKVIPDAEYGDYRGFRSGLAVEREIQYLLSHAGVAEGVHSLTYFGALAYNKLPESAVSAFYPDCLVDETPGVMCPVDGSNDTEVCYELDFGREPSLRIPSMYDNVGSHPIEIPVHPYPEHEPSPEAIKQREQSIREEYEYRWQCEHDHRERLKLKHERQDRLNDLTRDETTWFNWNDPLVQAWTAIRTVLHEGIEELDLSGCNVPSSAGGGLLRRQVHNFRRADLTELLECEPLEGIPDPVNLVIDLNLRTGRLEESPSGYLRLARQYTLQDALDEMRDMWFNNESPEDWRLERLLRANPSPDNAILSDTGFVFGGYPELAVSQTGARPGSVVGAE